MALNEKRLPNQELEDVKIKFRNFSGKPDQFNTTGKREFHVILDEPDALAMRADGWNVKESDPREEGDRPEYSVKVEVSYKARPPRIVMITSSGRSNLSEENVGLLDYVDIEAIDVVLNPYHWTMPSGASGIKAYLQSIYVTIKEDRFDRKYADVGHANAPVAQAVSPTEEWSR